MSGSLNYHSRTWENLSGAADHASIQILSASHRWRKIQTSVGQDLWSLYFLLYSAFSSTPFSDINSQHQIIQLVFPKIYQTALTLKLDPFLRRFGKYATPPHFMRFSCVRDSYLMYKATSCFSFYHECKFLPIVMCCDNHNV